MVFCTVLGVVTVISLTRFFSQNADKIDGWLKNFKYPDSVTSYYNNAGITFGVPYYIFISCIGLSYLAGKYS